MSYGSPDTIATTKIFGYVYEDSSAVPVEGARIHFYSAPFMIDDNLIQIDETVFSDADGLYEATIPETVLTATLVKVHITYTNSNDKLVEQRETIIVPVASPTSVQAARATGTETAVITGGAQGPTGATGAAGSSLAANFSYVVAAGTNGGAASTSWATRALNTTSGDTSFSSLATNRITLAAGTYVIFAACSAHFAYAVRTRFYDITNTAEVLSGSSEYASNSMTCSSIIHGVITVAADNTVFEVQQKSGLVQSTYGHGLATNFSESEIYTPTTILKIA